MELACIFEHLNKFGDGSIIHFPFGIHFIKLFHNPAHGSEEKIIEYRDIESRVVDADKQANAVRQLPDAIDDFLIIFIRDKISRVLQIDAVRSQRHIEDQAVYLLLIAQSVIW